MFAWYSLFLQNNVRKYPTPTKFMFEYVCYYVYVIVNGYNMLYIR